MNDIRVAVSQYGICFRANVGTVRMNDGRIFKTGLPRGFSDLFGVRYRDGKAFFLEVKTETGRPSKEQLAFIKIMKDAGAIAGVVRSAREAILLLTEN